ncbi:MAG TPA: asparagine synthase (glutamine-hydrolyzing) [Bryobacteraceae bacterium]|jgi:asparagine synthase (glutamine-hydrolysing)
MCGIAGFAGSPGTERPRQLVESMLPQLERRGPDAEGLATWSGVALGHRRLAIIDLSELGRQPMLSEDGEVGLVFNGCIYNFVELRQELQRAGHRFRSECDTEVLLRGYEEWGIDKLVPKLRGMFAFAIWDNRLRTLFLIRDRMGVKPLIYASRDQEIGFASTVSALRAAGLTQEIDPDAVLEFLEFGYVTDQRCIYRELRKVPPATIVEWRDGRISQRVYWSVPEIDPSSKITFNEAVEETERLIIESVHLRLVSDVPIGALLSGGIDSTLVCWAMTQLKADVKAFTVGAPGDPSNEGEQAASIAEKLGITHQVVTLREAGAPLDELAVAYGEPFACQSAMGVMRVSAAVKPFATVLLTGDGGDDVFLGYPYFYNAWRAERLACRLPPFAPGLWRATGSLRGATGKLRRAKNFLDYSVGGLGAYTRVRDGLPFFEHRNLLGERLQDRKLTQRQMSPSFASARRLLPDVFAYHLRTEFIGEYMPKVDGGTMYHGLEARAPFLDHKLWEFAAALPAGIRFHGGRLKAVLREIVARRVGTEVANRPKQGFTIPAEKWLLTHWRRSFEQLRSQTLLESEGWIAKGRIAGEMESALHTGAVAKQLWYLLVLENWLSHQHRQAPVLEDATAGVQ